MKMLEQLIYIETVVVSTDVSFIRITIYAIMYLLLHIIVLLVCQHNQFFKVIFLYL